MNKIIGLLALLFLTACSNQEDNLIQYRVLQQTELRTIKLSIDVEVQLVDGRLPNAEELGAISSYLVGKERKHDRSFVVFLLPNMKPGAGAFATAHHNPDMKVEILDGVLLTYPEYAGFVSD